jgi:hypothetical protein
MLTNNAPKATVTVAPGGTVTIMLAGQIPPGYEWRVAGIAADCNDDQNAQRKGGGVFACSDPDLKPQPNAFGNAYVAYVEAPNKPTTIRISYACLPLSMDRAGEGNNAVKVFEIEVVVQP